MKLDIDFEWYDLVDFTDDDGNLKTLRFPLYGSFSLAEYDRYFSDATSRTVDIVRIGLERPHTEISKEIWEPMLASIPSHIVKKAQEALIKEVNWNTETETEKKPQTGELLATDLPTISPPDLEPTELLEIPHSTS
jgi:hypothetical protein